MFRLEKFLILWTYNSHKQAKSSTENLQQAKVSTESFVGLWMEGLSQSLEYLVIPPLGPLMGGHHIHPNAFIHYTSTAKILDPILFSCHITILKKKRF